MVWSNNSEYANRPTSNYSVYINIIKLFLEEKAGKAFALRIRSMALYHQPVKILGDNCRNTYPTKVTLHNWTTLVSILINQFQKWPRHWLPPIKQAVRKEKSTFFVTYPGSVSDLRTVEILGDTNRSSCPLYSRSSRSRTRSVWSDTHFCLQISPRHSGSISNYQTSRFI